MKKLTGILSLVFAALSAIAQQDPQYSNYMFNHLAVNPAYAGSRDAINAAILYRNQWTGIDGAPQTSGLTLQGPLRKKKVGLGLQVVADAIGPKNSTGVLGSYAYRIPVGKGKLGMGVRAGVFAYRYDWSKISYKDQRDIYNTGGRDQVTVPTADAGLYYNTQSFYAGLSATHILRGRLTKYDNIQGRSSELTTHLFGTVGKAFLLSKNFVLNPSVMVKAAENAPIGVDLNVNALIQEMVWLGVSVRKGYGFVALAQYNINEQFRVGYSFDMGLNSIGIAGRGSHEIMLQYDFNTYKSKTLSPRFL